jgi:hypothetical protein
MKDEPIMPERPKRDPLMIVTRALLMGLPIQDGEFTLRLLERENGKGHDLFFSATRHQGTDAKGEEVWLHYEITFGGFVTMCERMSEEDLTLLAANTALNVVKPRKNREGVGA